MRILDSTLPEGRKYFAASDHIITSDWPLSAADLIDCHNTIGELPKGGYGSTAEIIAQELRLAAIRD
jgi:hypothetical protein